MDGREPHVGVRSVQVGPVDRVVQVQPADPIPVEADARVRTTVGTARADAVGRQRLVRRGGHGSHGARADVQELDDQVPGAVDGRWLGSVDQADRGVLRIDVELGSGRVEPDAGG